MKTLLESIFDDEETISKKTDSIYYLKDLAAKWENGNETHGFDTLGRPLKIGDLVINVLTCTSPIPGRIIDIKNKKYLISNRGDGSEYISDYGPRKGQMKVLSSDYVCSYELLKIDDKILELIYKLK